MSEPFKDHFSGYAADYALNRPNYPDELFAWLAEEAARHDLAWDCATGNGQAVPGIAARFGRVIATDASAAQIANARPLPNVEYRVAPAERSGLEPASVDLVTVAQAMHWIDRPAFYAEVSRVARRGALLAVWTYSLVRIDPEIDPLIDAFEHGVVGSYWPPERRLVDAGYRTIDFPFPEIDVPAFSMVATWNLERFVGYIRSWSAVDRYRKANGRDPVEEWLPSLAKVWGGPELSRRVEWPLHIRAGTV